MNFFNKVKLRFKNYAMRSYSLVRVLFYRLLSNCKLEGRPKYIQPVLVIGAGKILINGNVKIGYYPSPLFFSTYAHIEARGAHSSIVINDGTKINNNFCAIAEHTSITIGYNCLFGTSVEILDSNFHGLEVLERNSSKAEWAKPVIIEDNVFIGSNSKILKGVTIGTGAVVANSSVVVRDVPPYTVVGGNPAKHIKQLEHTA